MANFNYFNFEHRDNDNSFSANYNNDDGFMWPGLVENFLRFLRGCGYLINTQDFIDYVQSQIQEVEEAEDD